MGLERRDLLNDDGLRKYGTDHDFIPFFVNRSTLYQEAMVCLLFPYSLSYMYNISGNIAEFGREYAMQSMTLEQLRATVSAGGVTGVTLKGQGGGFFVEIATRSGQDAILSKARSTEPRRFGNPTSALVMLRGIGITVAQLDATHWTPGQKDMTRSRQSRAKALHEAHKAAAYNQWLSTEIQEAIDDPRPSLPHDEVMTEMDAEISAMTGTRKCTPGAGGKA